MEIRRIGTAVGFAGAIAFLVAAGLAVSLGLGEPAGEKQVPYRSPYDLAFSPDGKTLAVSDHTAGTVAIVDMAKRKISHEVAVGAQPTGVAWSPDGKRLFVAERDNGTVSEIDAVTARVLRRFQVGPRPVGLAVAPKRRLLLVANSASNNVSLVDLSSGKEKARIAVARSPCFLAVTPDEALAVVGNLLPAGSAADPQTSAAISLIDLEKLERVADVRLPPNASLVRGVAVSPGGRWAYAVHTLGRTALPTMQLERGWVNTNALSVIDLEGKELFATVLLDRLAGGAADPWGVVVSRDGATLWVTLAGVHHVAKVDLANLHRLMAGELPEGLSPDELRGRGYSSLWLEISEDPGKRALLANDLAALCGAGLLRRTRIPGKGPRGVDIAPDGKTLAVGVYFAGEVVLADPATGAVKSRISLGPSREPDIVRRGQVLFHDATYCFQHWLSCATCHPGGRADGLNWDLLNDGIGNPKNTRSLVLSHKTPPVMSRGVRASMDVAALAGFRFIQVREPETDAVEAVRAYIRSLQPEPGPCALPDAELSKWAKRGEAIFESARAGCAECHPAPLYTDLKSYNVGTRRPLDCADEFDTPTLVELWRTGPYLHSGEAVTLEEVFTKFNAKDQHGTTSHLSKEELDALVEYLKSL